MCIDHPVEPLKGLEITYVPTIHLGCERVAQSGFAKKFVAAVSMVRI